jgi:hypothetical protein
MICNNSDGNNCDNTNNNNNNNMYCMSFDLNVDGLTIFDTSTAQCLHSKAIRHYPSVHPDFLSFNGKISIYVFMNIYIYIYIYVYVYIYMYI